MKMKQARLIRKPMFVVPNHLLWQFSQEFMQLYPNAKLLVATKEDMSREKPKMLTTKIASGDWDGIIVRIAAWSGLACPATIRSGSQVTLGDNRFHVQTRLG